MLLLPGLFFPGLFIPGLFIPDQTLLKLTALFRILLAVSSTCSGCMCQYQVAARNGVQHQESVVQFPFFSLLAGYHDWPLATGIYNDCIAEPDTGSTYELMEYCLGGLQAAATAPALA